MANYHLRELEIASNPSDRAHLIPPPRPAGTRILDIGCGAGQTLIAAYPNQAAFGLDPDLLALKLGKTLTQAVSFACGRAESLPYRDSSFDFVIARLSLPYTDIPASIAEIRRVLRPGGELWIALHPLWIPVRNAWRTRSIKGWIFFAYTFLNGILFHLFQKQLPFLGRFESFQTSAAMRRCLKRNGFVIATIRNDSTFLIRAAVGC